MAGIFAGKINAGNGVQEQRTGKRAFGLFSAIAEHIEIRRTRNGAKKMTLELIEQTGSKAENIDSETYGKIFPHLFKQAFANGAKIKEIYAAARRNWIVEREVREAWNEMPECWEADGSAEDQWNERDRIISLRGRMFLGMLVEACADAAPNKIFNAASFALKMGGDKYEIASIIFERKINGRSLFFMGLTSDMLKSMRWQAKEAGNKELESELWAASGIKTEAGTQGSTLKHESEVSGVPSVIL